MDSLKTKVKEALHRGNDKTTHGEGSHLSKATGVPYGTSHPTSGTQATCKTTGDTTATGSTMPGELGEGVGGRRDLHPAKGDGTSFAPSGSAPMARETPLASETNLTATQALRSETAKDDTIMSRPTDVPPHRGVPTSSELGVTGSEANLTESLAPRSEAVMGEEIVGGPTDVAPHKGQPEVSSTATGERAPPGAGRDVMGEAAAALGLGGVYEGHKHDEGKQTQDSSQGVTGIATGRATTGSATGQGPHDSSIANKLDPRVGSTAGATSHSTSSAGPGLTEKAAAAIGIGGAAAAAKEHHDDKKTDTPGDQPSTESTAGTGGTASSPGVSEIAGSSYLGRATRSDSTNYDPRQPGTYGIEPEEYKSGHTASAATGPSDIAGGERHLKHETSSPATGTGAREGNFLKYEEVDRSGDAVAAVTAGAGLGGAYEAREREQGHQKTDSGVAGIDSAGEAGPHDSNIGRKLDPRVDSGNGDTKTGKDKDHHYGRDAGLTAAGGAAAYEATKHQDRPHDEKDTAAGTADHHRKHFQYEHHDDTALAELTDPHGHHEKKEEKSFNGGGLFGFLKHSEKDKDDDDHHKHHHHHHKEETASAACTGAAVAEGHEHHKDHKHHHHGDAAVPSDIGTDAAAAGATRDPQGAATDPASLTASGATTQPGDYTGESDRKGHHHHGAETVAGAVGVGALAAHEHGKHETAPTADTTAPRADDGGLRLSGRGREHKSHHGANTVAAATGAAGVAEHEHYKHKHHDDTTDAKHHGDHEGDRERKKSGGLFGFLKKSGDDPAAADDTKRPDYHKAETEAGVGTAGAAVEHERRQDRPVHRDGLAGALGRDTGAAPADTTAPPIETTTASFYQGLLGHTDDTPITAGAGVTDTTATDTTGNGVTDTTGATSTESKLEGLGHSVVAEGVKVEDRF